MNCTVQFGENTCHGFIEMISITIQSFFRQSNGLGFVFCCQARCHRKWSEFGVRSFTTNYYIQSEAATTYRHTIQCNY